MLAAALSPLVVFFVILLAEELGHVPRPSLEGIGRMLGWPDIGVGGFLLLSMIVTGFGEETGWRGFALPRLQQHHSALAATVILTLAWGFWHTPLFFMHEGLPVAPAVVPVFYLGLFCGAVMLTWIYNRTGGSVLMAALFHVSNNLASGTDASRGFIQAFETSAVVIGALVLLVLDSRARRRGTASILSPR